MVGTIVVKPGSGSSSSAVSSSSVSTVASKSTSGPPPGAQISIAKGASANQNSPGITPDLATVVVGVNNTITWTNNDIIGHTVTFTSQPSGASATSSELIGPGLTFTETLTVPGTYHYIDGIDDWIKGTIIVVAG